MYFRARINTNHFMSKKLILLIILGTAGYFNGQEKAEQALETFEEKYPQEKIHLLFDKKNHVAGENLWFKSFVFDGYAPSGISTTLFVELYDRNRKQISKKLVPLFNGEGSGSIALPETLKEDIYYIRAYTAWMANFSEEFQLVRPIAVYNPSSGEKLEIDSSASWTASAYPESGSFINGINTKFAVRMQSQGIPPSDWKGTVVDKENPSVSLTSFKGLDQNVGIFSITPQTGKRYQVIIEDRKGQKQSIDLPEVSATGISLQVTSQVDAVKYSLKAGGSLQPSQYYKVLGTINNQLVYKARVNKIANETSYSIPTNQLVNGILQLTVFDDQENIVAQRLCFVQPDLLKVKQPSLQAFSPGTAPRQASSFDIARNLNLSNYTVAVLDADTPDPEEEQSILSTLWLTGDITSPIISPAQYFTKNHNIEALDALLISEKWKRFDWKSIISGNYPAIRYKPEPYLSYTGALNVKGKPAPNTDLNLIFDMPDSGMKLNQLKTDSKGSFVLSGMLFEDSLNFSYQLNSDQKEKNDDSRVFFQPNFSFVPYRGNLPVSRYKLTGRTGDEKLPSDVIQAVSNQGFQKDFHEKITTIEEIKLKGQKKDNTRKLNEQLSSPLFRTSSEEIFDFVNGNYTPQGSSNILQWLQGRVAGLQIQLQQGNYIPYIRGSRVSIYLDEMMSDANQISTVPVSDIAMIKVIKGFFAGGLRGGDGGAIIIYTRRGSSSNASSQQFTRLKKIALSGYDKSVPFNNDLYEGINPKDISSQDTRSVLYWNPNLESQANQPATVKFYNNDTAKKYRVIIVGFDKNNDEPLYYNGILK